MIESKNLLCKPIITFLLTTTLVFGNLINSSYSYNKTQISNSSNNTKSLNGSVSKTFGDIGLNFNLEKGTNNFLSNSLINNNSQLIANNVYLNVNNDANFMGVNVKANDSLKLDVGNNLNLVSLKDEYSFNSI